MIVVMVTTVVMTVVTEVTVTTVVTVVMIQEYFWSQVEQLPEPLPRPMTLQCIDRRQPVVPQSVQSTNSYYCQCSPPTPIIVSHLNLF